MKPRQIIDLSHHNLNISINVRLSTEAILTPMNDINLVIEEILLLEQMQVLTKDQLKVNVYYKFATCYFDKTVSG